MGASYVKIYVHITFHTKNSGLTIRISDLPRIFAYIGGIIRALGGTPIKVGGMPDHIHIFATLPKTMSIAEFVRTIKAKSSKWIKSMNQEYQWFAWQEGYAAFSASHSIMPRITRYIQNQAIHHVGRSFDEELRAMLERTGIELSETNQSDNP